MVLVVGRRHNVSDVVRRLDVSRMLRVMTMGRGVGVSRFWLGEHSKAVEHVVVEAVDDVTAGDDLGGGEVFEGLALSGVVGVDSAGDPTRRRSSASAGWMGPRMSGLWVSGYSRGSEYVSSGPVPELAGTLGPCARSH
ncbi:hypothetical protein [Streptomyces sp. ISL-94]|uniref:hypothetical protein n=1 Tax=Streptomyces sp. ISL-94 TaxID=2819190 RepID=UPI001BEC5B74|nr:hypothetical protein [Streptomyces sp. ISL-94]MBT2478157.1 hypothetical protein [Streptomyces sp. ISL-94]